MNKCKGTLFRSIATRAVIAVIPAAMVSAYASGIFVSPPRMAAYDYIQVAEITQTPNTIGMAESPLYGMSQADIDATLDQLQSIGVQNIRVFVPWGLIEQTDNTYDWSLLDRVMSAAAARNMGVMAEVNGTPTWAGPNPGNPGFPLGSDTPNTAAFVNFMQAFMAHQWTVNGPTYADVVSAYEIWNEPNYIQFSNPISPEAYASLLAAIYPAIKAVDPSATVVAGAVGATQDSPFTMDPVEFVQRMLTALGPNALNLFDALSIHPYGDQIPFSGSCPTCPAGMLTPREQVEAIMAMIGDKKVWLSEYGVASTDAAGYQQQAQWITDLLDTWQTYSQAGPVFIYTGRDSTGTDPGADMGVWTESGGEKVYTVNGVTYTVSQLLAQWIAAHPMPTNPGIPILSPIVALVQSVVAGVQAFVNAIVTAITNFLGGFSGLAGVTTSAAPLTLRVASVESPEAGAAGTGEATAADAKGAEAASKEAATEKTATEKTATEETATEEVATVATAAEATATPAQPAVEETVTKTETETTVPAKATETATTTEPAKTTETTGSTETSTGATTPGSSPETGKPDEAGKSGDAGKSAEAGKSGASEGQSKSGKVADHEDGSGRHAHGKDGGGSVEIKAKPVPVTVGVTAGAEGASDSTGGATS
ncbi:MAG: polysaccharide biosynthesis protein PslG [Mycobacterium sp.]|nr:polysaccharide biosynthesis protein PslG [Mycobacterium sp.]